MLNIVGMYQFNVTLNNFQDVECKPVIVQEAFNSLDSTSGSVLSVVSFKQGTSCVTSVTCPNCYILGTSAQISLSFSQQYAMASDMQLSMIIPYFYQGNSLTVNTRIYPSAVGQGIFKGNKNATIIPFILTKSVYSLLPDAYQVKQLLGAQNNLQVGYAVMRSAINKGTIVSSEEEFMVNSGLTVTIPLTINTYGFFIKQDGRMSILDYVSKVAALTVTITSVCVIVMNVLEGWCFTGDIERARRKIVEAWAGSITGNHTGQGNKKKDDELADLSFPSE